VASPSASDAFGVHLPLMPVEKGGAHGLPFSVITLLLLNILRGVMTLLASSLSLMCQYHAADAAAASGWCCDNLTLDA